MFHADPAAALAQHCKIAAPAPRLLTMFAGIALGLGALTLTPHPLLAQDARPTEKSADKSSDKPAPAVTRAASAAGKEQPLPIRRITLYRSGVGSFERRGLVDGNAQIQLRFTTDQINDILKSMIVLDLSKGKGTIDGVSYGSKEPLARRLSSFGIDISDNPATDEILQRLRGTSVKLFLPDGNVSGIIVNVENRPTVFTGTDRTSATKFDLPWINLLTETGVRSFNLTTATGFDILDANLAGELNKALAALAEHRADRTKTVDVNLRGEGARDIVVAYVQETPVWKTSYRLVLPDAQAPDAKPAEESKPAPSTATLQGWAIVENTSDEDWNDVRLSLVSGRPVSFRMDLYEPLHVFRPEIPVPTVPGVMPREYAGAVAEKKAELMMSKAGARRDAMGRAATAPGSPPAAMSPFRDNSGAVAEASERGISSEDIADYAAKSQARAREAGEVFQFELETPVTVERQRSAMLPIISTNIEGRRVSIFSTADGSSNPMRGVEVTNSSGLQLMPGPISVFDSGTYAGDAQIGYVPAGDKRLLAYAVDLDVVATHEQSAEGRVRKVRIVKGLMEITRLRREKVTYTFDNKDAKRARTIIVEHPRYDGWKLAEPAAATETTQNLYRFEVSLDAAKAGKLAVAQERTESQSIALLSVDLGTLTSFSKEGEVSGKVIEAFKEAAKRQAAIVESERELATLQQERQTIDQDQDRIRSNMNGIDRQSQLYSRYMQKLTEQESRLEAIDVQLKDLQATIKTKREELDLYVASINAE